MKIVHYQDRNTNDVRINEATLAVKSFFENSNYDYTYVDLNSPIICDADVAIMWGSFDPNSPPRVKNTFRRRDIKKAQQKNNGLLIEIEVGFIKRHEYYSIGFDDITGFGNYRFIADSPTPRITLPNILPLRKPNSDSPIVIAGQIPHDTQIRLGGSDNYIKWLKDIIHRIKGLTKRDIVFKPHPKLNKSHVLNKPSWSLQQGIKLDQFYDISKAWVVVTYNSNISLESLIAGIPCFCESRGSVVYDICNHDINEVENPWFPTYDEIHNVLSRITWYQWTKEEIQSGTPFKFMLQ